LEKEEEETFSVGSLDMAKKREKKKRIPNNYGDNPRVADFGPDFTIDDIRFPTRSVELTVGQKKVTKTVTVNTRR
jgi:hypothetical protein